MRNLYFLACFLCLQLDTTAQQIHRCYTDEYMEYQNSIFPGLKNNRDQLFDAAKNYNVGRSANALGDTIYRIPVVVHIVYNTSEENIDDSLIYSQLEVLNRDFRRLNADTLNTRTIFKDRAADVGFQFHLATIDPIGNPTTGITRTFTSETSFGGFFPNPSEIDKVKKTSENGIDAWNTEEYLNIWVCNTGGSILGFAYPPTNAPNWQSGTVPSDPGLWGVVISYEVFGFNNPKAIGQLNIADQGRTAVHEVGHFMGLRHIWGDSGFFGSIDCDITLDDTPHMGSNSQQSGCDFAKNTCSNSESPDEPDMPENYMDYSTELCQNMFTKGQANIMRSMARIGRPDLANFIHVGLIDFNIGDYIVVNGIDTIQINGSNIPNLDIGDEVVFLNFNDGVTYTIIVDNGSTISSNNIYTSDTKGNISISQNGSTDINKLTDNDLYNIFPNPVQDNLTIKTKHSFDKIELISIDGKKVLNKENIKSHSISIENLSNGIYIVNIFNHGKLMNIQKISIRN